MKPKAFTNLFNDIERNQQTIQTALYLLAHHVTDIHMWHCQDDRDDAAANAATTAMQKLHKFNPNAENANAFNYFTSVVRNSLLFQHRSRQNASKVVRIGMPIEEESHNYQASPPIKQAKENDIRRRLSEQLGPDLTRQTRQTRQLPTEAPEQQQQSQTPPEAPRRPPVTRKPAEAREAKRPAGKPYRMEDPAKAAALLASKPELSPALIDQLTEHVKQPAIADLLNAHGYQTAKGKPWTFFNLRRKMTAGSFEDRTSPPKAAELRADRLAQRRQQAEPLLDGKPTLTVELVKQLSAALPYNVVAEMLNVKGYRTANGKPYNVSAVQNGLRYGRFGGKKNKNGEPRKLIARTLYKGMKSEKITELKVRGFDVLAALEQLQAQATELQNEKVRVYRELEQLLKEQKPEGVKVAE